MRASADTILRFRIPLGLFRSRERLIITILARAPGGEESVLWLKRWEAAWHGKDPSLEPVAE